VSQVVVGFTVKVQIRVRATNHLIAWTETAILIGVALVPTTWMVLCTGVGVAVGTAVARMPPIKAAFGISKNILLTAVAGGTLAATGLPSRPTPAVGMVAALALAYCAAVVLDELLTLPVIALATGTELGQLFREDWGLRLASALARFPVIVATLVLGSYDHRLLVAVPPLVLSLHFAYSTRVRARMERQAWQQLAQTTDALNVVDLDAVLTTAVTRAAELFSADEVEVELHDSGRLVRGAADGISYDGPAANAPATEEASIPARLEGPDGSADIGLLRLRFRGPVELSERERYTLRTFASALCTALRNASAYQELTRIAERNAIAAAQDSLTGLANRRQLLKHGAELLAGPCPGGLTALLLIDLNHFKEVNDTLGHAAGDRVLIHVADRLRASMQADDVVARLGGDEFAVLITGIPAPAVARHRAERVLAALNQPIDLDGMRISVEASGGIAIAPVDGGMTELLRQADVAMYQAKRGGRRVDAYVPARDPADVNRLSIGGELPRAVAEREFTVNFQPIVDLGTGEAIAAEALTRWQHPARGTIDPLRFLHAVERSGILPAFTEEVLEQSLAAATSWRAAGFDLPVAVNVSPRSLLDLRFPGTVLARLRSYDLPADQLILELTETLTISQLEVVDQALAQLRDAGVRLALDDFGTGYSSLSVVSRIPVHELKIDRAFVVAMDTAAEAVAVIRSTVDLGRSLNLTVVAEGVESETQRRTLWEFGCGAGQGHLFGRP
ncbi:MAG TPA: bifunctional diguanylate cyclase/phosphodiesterase, partial [Micromonospora sp.]